MNKINKYNYNFYLTNTEPCPYLTNRDEKKIFLIMDDINKSNEYEHLIKSGFRRSHNILYKRSVMIDMLSLIERNFKKKWYLAILNNVNKNLHSCHSDFETYAQYFYNYHNKSMKIEYWLKIYSREQS